MGDWKPIGQVELSRVVTNAATALRLVAALVTRLLYAFLAETHVATIEPEPFSNGRMAPKSFHRRLPVGGADGVARPPLQVQAQAGAGKGEFAREPVQGEVVRTGLFIFAPR